MIENRSFLYPIITLVLIIGLILFSAKVLISNISGLSSELGENRKKEQTLQTKFASLQQILPEVSNSSQVSIFALPSTSPVLTVVSSIRTQALILGLGLNSFSSGEVITSNQNKDILSGEIVFDVDGSFQNISALIKTIKGSAPVTKFDAIKILNQASAGSDTYKFTAHLFVYWAPLPKTIPAANEPFVGLSDEENKVLSQISNLTTPNIVSTEGSPSASPSAPSNRVDPFAL